MATQSPFYLLDEVVQKLGASLQPPTWAVQEAQRRIVLLLNHVLQQEPQATQRLARQKGRVVLFQWREFSFKLQLTPAGLLDLAAAAERQGVDLVVFPELCLTAYAIDDLHSQQALLDAARAALASVVKASERLRAVLVVGLPLARNGRLYNCAVAITQGRVLGVVPKTFLPNYREYYEKRWFASGQDIVGETIELGGMEVPFGTDLVFRAANLPDFTFHLEICEDMCVPQPPSIRGALAGATVLCNLSASNITVGKADERAMLCAAQSARCLAAYVYAAAGAGESTTDLAWDGQGAVFELGEELASSERFSRVPQLAVADVDVQRLRLERMRNGSFNDSAIAAGHPEREFRRIDFTLPLHDKDVGLKRALRRAMDALRGCASSPTPVERGRNHASMSSTEPMPQPMSRKRTDSVASSPTAEGRRPARVSRAMKAVTRSSMDQRCPRMS